MEQEFKNKVALVTGAASGIGRASAIAFAERGAKVIVADIQKDLGEETVALIKKIGGEAAFVEADVSQSTEVKALIEKTIQHYGRLDFAHNNAGIRGQRQRIHNSNEETWDRIIDTNLKSVWLCMKYEIPEMLKLGGGAIVNTSSVTGLVGYSKLAPYSASKHGIIGLTKTAALEYANAGIRVNAVCPGYIDTPMMQRSIYGKIRATSPLRKIIRDAKKWIGYSVLKLEQPARRLGLSEEVAEAVVWLCSDASSFVNGHALPVDGGFLSK